MTYAEIMDLEDAASAAGAARSVAERHYRRSRTNRNWNALAEATAELDAAIDALDAARAVLTAEDAAVLAGLASLAAGAAAFAQPTLF
jgi:hypothetical protein